MPATPRRVLVTGSAGAVGQPVCRELLLRGHHVRGLDLKPSSVASEQIAADLADHDAVLRAAEGCDTIVHLAAYPNDAPFLDVLLRPNVVGLFNVCDAARQHQARRLVLASSIQAVGHATRHAKAPGGGGFAAAAQSANAASGGATGSGTLRVEHGAEPSNHYGLTKLWLETMGRMYAQTYRLSVLAVRIIWLPRTESDIARLQRSGYYASYLSPGDAGRFFACAVEADRPAPGGFAIVFAASKPQRHPPPYDLDAARDLIGYQPQDAWPDGAPGTERPGAP